MKKLSLALIIFFFMNIVFYAQIPDCYYNSTKLRISEKEGKLGFVDTDDSVKIQYLYDDLTNFSWYSYAIAKRDKKVFFIDTLGNEHLIVENPELLTKETKGVNLSYLNLKEIPEQLFEHRPMEYLLLSGNQIKTLSKDITNLKDLKFLGLCSNEITDLPEEIVDLHKLKYLTLDYNSNLNYRHVFKLFKDYPKKIILSSDMQNFSLDPEALLISITWSDLEPNDIEMLQNLTQLSLSDYNNLNLKTLLPVLEKMRQNIILTNDSEAECCDRDTILLKISGNTDLPSELGKLTNLVKLNLTGFDLKEENPLSLSNSVNLSSLKLIRCNLNEMPDYINSLENLTELNLKENFLEFIPEEIGKFEKLSHLNLSLNDLIEFNFPFANSPNITHLDISGNDLDFLSDEIKNLKNLKNLNLTGNDFVIFPDEILDLINLSELNLSENYLDIIPKEITKLKHLIKLDLSENDIIELPSNIRKLINLETLILSGNEIKDNEKKRIKAALPNCKIQF